MGLEGGVGEREGKGGRGEGNGGKGMEVEIGYPVSTPS